MKIFLSILFFSLLLISGCCFCDAGKDSPNVPEEIVNRSDQFLISKTGNEFFNSYISSDYKRAVKTADGYLMVYNFSIPGKPGVEGEIKFNVDDNGNIISEKEISGIPDCLSNPANCTFNISKEEAVRIAADNGLRTGIKKWDVNFKWNSLHKKYVWEIKSVYSEAGEKNTYSATGETMLINTASGEVIETGEWMIN
jgi:hypothetical protein